MSGKAVISALSIGGYSILAIPTQSIGGYSIPAIPTQSAAYTWLRGGGCVGVAAWVWQGCHTLLLIHLRRPMRMSASTDADVCTDRYGCLRRPMQMSASTDADVCADRCGCLRRPMRIMQGGLSCSGKRQSRAQHVFDHTISFTISQ